MAQCSDTYGTPIRIPSADLRKCSLLCSIEFIYPDANWNITAVEVENENSSKKILRYYTRDPEEVSSTSVRRGDVRYNGNMYTLQFIEFFIPSLHEYTVDTELGERYDIEVVLYHATASKDAKWLNVSIFVTPMYTYSISQGFFTSIIEPLQKNTLSRSTSYLAGVSYESYFPTISAQCASVSPSASKTNMAKCITLETDERWNPYMALPLKKGFYIYKGEFPCDDSISNIYPTDASDVNWVLMANTVAMHYSDYEHLRKVYSHNKYNLNTGSLYTVKSLSGRPVYYNDGEYVQGNMDRDRFYIKCTKKEQKPAVTRLTFTPETGVDESTNSATSSILNKM